LGNSGARSSEVGDSGKCGGFVAIKTITEENFRNGLAAKGRYDEVVGLGSDEFEEGGRKGLEEFAAPELGFFLGGSGTDGVEGL
jgi:hypothetical protein